MWADPNVQARGLRYGAHFHSGMVEAGDTIPAHGSQNIARVVSHIGDFMLRCRGFLICSGSISLTHSSLEQRRDGVKASWIYL